MMNRSSRTRISAVSLKTLAFSLAMMTVWSEAEARPLTLGFSMPPPSRGGASVCQPFPIVPPGARVVNKYAKGRAQDTLDPDAADQYKRQSAGFHDSVRLANEMTSRYLQTGDSGAAACILAGLKANAQANAMTGDMALQAAGLRAFTLPSLALAFTVAAPLAEPSDRRLIADWLRRVDDEVIRLGDQRASRPVAPGKIPEANNLLYWTAYASMLTGVATGDAERFEWGRQHILRGLSDITADGFLPAEAHRGSRALEYHAYALQPLTMGVYLMKANGEAPDPTRMAALLRLGQRTIRGLQDPQGFSNDMGRRFGGEAAFQTDVPRAPPFVEVMAQLFGPTPEILEGLRRFAPAGPGNLGPAPAVLFARRS